MVRDMRNLELFRNLGWLYGELLSTLKKALVCRRSGESRLIVLSV